MNAKELRKEMADQIKRVSKDLEGIPQADAVANLVGKMHKIFVLEMQAEALRDAGRKYEVLTDILGK